MKKKIIGGGIIAAIAIVMTFNLSIVFGSDASPGFNLQDVEARAQFEWGDDDIGMELTTRYCSNYSDTYETCETSFDSGECNYNDETQCPNDGGGNDNGGGNNGGGNTPKPSDIVDRNSTCGYSMNINRSHSWYSYSNVYNMCTYCGKFSYK